MAAGFALGYQRCATTRTTQYSHTVYLVIRRLDSENDY